MISSRLDNQDNQPCVGKQEYTASCSLSKSKGVCANKAHPPQVLAGWGETRSTGQTPRRLHVPARPEPEPAAAPPSAGSGAPPSGPTGTCRRGPLPARCTPTAAQPASLSGCTRPNPRTETTKWLPAASSRDPFVPFGPPNSAGPGYRRPGPAQGLRGGPAGPQWPGTEHRGGGGPARPATESRRRREDGGHFVWVCCSAAAAGSGGRGPGGGSDRGVNTYRLLFLLHSGGHLRHGPVYRGVFVQVGQILTAEDRQRLRGVQRPRPERQFTHLRRSRYLSALGKRPRPAGSWRTGVAVSTRLPRPGTWGRSASPPSGP